MTQYNSRALFIAVFQICLLIAFNSAVFANSSSYYDKDGATVYPLETNSIVMKKEVVKIKPSRDGWSATCLFTFYNKSDSSEPVTMGYPDWLKADFKPDSPESYGPFWGFFRTLPAEVRTKYEEDGFGAGYAYSGIYSDGYKQGKIPYIGDAWNLHDLAVSIDGKKVKTKHKAVVDAKSLPGDGAFIWKVTFAPHETKQVKVSFSFSGFHEAEGYQKAIYILQTGALWADKIGMADIYWDIKGQNVNVKQIVPQDFKQEGNIIHWHFEDFKPTEDIVIYEGDYFENDPKYVTDTVAAIYRTKKNYDGNSRLYNDYDVSDKKLDKQLHQLYLKALRNEIYARNGRPFKSEELNSLFHSCGWYAPKEDYSDEFLNEFEKKNLKFISDYEKKKGWRFQPPAKKPSGRQKIESPGGNVFLGANYTTDLQATAKEEIFRRRQREIDRYRDLEIFPTDYIPNKSIFGQIDDKIGWLQDTPLFLLNPYLLVMEAGGEYVNGIFAYCPMSSLTYSPKRITISYEKESAKKWRHYINDYYQDSRGVIRLWFVNAMDAGFPYAHVDPARSENVEPVPGAPADHVMKGVYAPTDFFHVGRKGKNNISPNDAKAKLKLKDPNAKTTIYVKLWRQKPVNANAPEDFSYVIDVATGV